MVTPCGSGVAFRDDATGELRSIHGTSREYNLMALRGPWTQVLTAKPGMAVLKEPGRLRISGDVDLPLEGASADLAILSPDGDRLAALTLGDPSKISIWSVAQGVEVQRAEWGPAVEGALKWVGEQPIAQLIPCENCSAEYRQLDNPQPLTPQAWRADPEPGLKLGDDSIIAVAKESENTLSVTLGEITASFELQPPAPEQPDCLEESNLVWAPVYDEHHLLVVEQTHICDDSPWTRAVLIQPEQGALHPLPQGARGTAEDRLLSAVRRWRSHAITTDGQVMAADGQLHPQPDHPLEWVNLPMLNLRATPTAPDPAEQD